MKRLLLLSTVIISWAGCASSSPSSTDGGPPQPDLHAIDASGTCPANLATGAGSACPIEGVICNDCLTACSTCTEIACNGGKWVLEESDPPMCDGGAD